jgi:opacity protein-like surface antigen
VFLTSAALLVGASAYAQSASPTPATNQSRSESLTDEWTGFYAGANVGHLSQALGGAEAFPIFATVQTPTVSISFPSRVSGSAGFGIQVGYASTLTHDLVGGLDVRLSHSSPAGEGPGGVGVLGVTDDTTFRGGLGASVRARLGLAMTHRLLLYAIVGEAMSRLTAEENFLGVTNGSITHTMKGPAVGLGAEYAPWKRHALDRLTLSAEFVHAWLGTQTFAFAPVGTAPTGVIIPTSASVTSQTNQFDVRLNYCFSVRRR